MKRKQYFSLILAIILAGSHINAIYAEEIQPYATNIGYLGTALVVSGSCLEGSVTGSFTGNGLHAIYYSEFQYLSAYGEYTTTGDQRSFRSYEELTPATFEAYYCNPIPGVKYRFHTNMKVYDSNDNIKDSDVINSNTVVW